MLVVPAVQQPCFPSFGASTHHKQNHEGGRRMLDVYAQESSFQSERASVHTHRLGGNEDPTALYEQGPRTWPSLALRKESDQVLEGSGIIGWLQYLQMREEEALRDDTTGEETRWLKRLRDRAQQVAKSSLDAVTWGPHRSNTFNWLEGVFRDIKAAPRRTALRCPKFKVGMRGDYQDSIRKAAQSLHMCETKWSENTEEPFDFYWGEQWDDMKQYLNAGLHPSAIVSSILGWRKAMGDKKALSRIFANCLEEQSANGTHQGWCEFTKRGFNLGRQGKVLRGQYQLFREHAIAISSENQMPQLWILKAQQSYNQMGIQMLALGEEDVKDDDATLRWLNQNVPDGTWTLQEYVMNPAKYGGRKFDMRVWAMITSTDPLRIMLDRKFMPKISTKHYSTSIESMSDSCMHFKMPMGTECKKEYLPEPYPIHTATAEFYRNVKFARPIFDTAEFWNRVVVPQVERIICLVVLLSREEPLANHRILMERGADFRRFLFLSPDFIIDHKGRAFLVEMNTNGFMPGDDVLYKMQKDTADALHVLGADGFPHHHEYKHKLAQLWKDFCKSSDAHAMHCDGELGHSAKRAVWELIHEEVHAFPTAWYRIFPSMFTNAHEALQQLDPDKFVTPLDAIIRDFLRFRELHNPLAGYA